MKFLTKAAIVFALAALAPSLALAQYVRTDLVTNTGGPDIVQDAHVVNAWGLVSTATSPFWVSDNGTGVSTLYTIDNVGGVISAVPAALVVSIPSVATPPNPSGPTGIVAANTPAGTSAFVVSTVNAAGKTVSGNSIFIFATLDGTIVGWNPGVKPTTGVVGADRSGVGATYTGLTIATNNGQKFLYAADDGTNRRVDVFNSEFQLQNFSADAFVDPKMPKNFAPYGIQAITNADGTQTIWVTYTALDKAQSGFVDSFTTDGTLLTHFALNGPLHSPWGVAMAPADFGPMSNALLVTNNTPHGRINAFDPATGVFLGPLRDAGGQVIEIDDIWGIQFGRGGSNGKPNQLFFTAGNNNYGSGTFGVITLPQ